MPNRYDRDVNVPVDEFGNNFSAPVQINQRDSRYRR